MWYAGSDLHVLRLFPTFDGCLLPVSQGVAGPAVDLTPDSMAAKLVSQQAVMDLIERPGEVHDEVHDGGVGL